MRPYTTLLIFRHVFLRSGSTMEQTENQKRSAARLAQVDDVTTKRVAVEVRKKVAEMASEGRGRKGTGISKPNHSIVPRISAAGDRTCHYYVRSPWDLLYFFLDSF